jgi:membrane protease YdiL (CAAX protease family)
MEANLPASPPTETAPPPARFPYANWGPGAAIVGLFAALVAQLLLAAPVALIDGSVSTENPSTGASIALQLITAATFFVAPVLVASMKGGSWRDALSRLGLRRFGRSAFKWMAAAVGVYLLVAMLYAAIVGEPEQTNIAEDFGPVPIQVLLIVIAAPISEEVCFRGMVFGGLRQRMPRLGAAALSALIFGALHAFTGISAVPPLIVFGFILALLYEKTGSIVPGTLLHMINNTAALLAG